MAMSEWESEAMESFAERLEYSIKDKYKSVTQLSKESGIPESTLRNYKYALQYPEINMLPLLAKHLDVPVDELLWNGGEWQIIRNRIKKKKDGRPEYIDKIREWKDRPFSVLLTNAIIYEYGSIEECADDIKIPTATLTRYASGLRIPKTKYLKRICETFNLSADDALKTIDLEVKMHENVQ